MSSSLSLTALREGVFAGSGFALYRLPGEKTYTLLAQYGAPKEYVSFREAKEEKGFLLIPFSPERTTPILILTPEYVESDELPSQSPAFNLPIHYNERREHERYIEDFGHFLSAFARTRCKKLVLSRRMEVVFGGKDSPSRYDLFVRACLQNPDRYVCLFWTKTTGCWLIASPELLLASGGDTSWQTMALAGTKAPNDRSEWSATTLLEHRIVSNYIRRQLVLFGNNVRVTLPYPVETSGIVHLRTDLSFSTDDKESIFRIIRRLHPTPAVGGMPREVARRTVLANERNPRRYYAGLTGPLFMSLPSSGNAETTRLFVSLRCMELFPSRAYLYAGSGLLQTSNEEEEWEETRLKMQTMLRVLSKGV